MEKSALINEIERRLIMKYRGMIVAIDLDSGDHFIGESVLDAYRKAIKKYPDRKFVFKKIGAPTTYFVGAV